MDLSACLESITLDHWIRPIKETNNVADPHVGHHLGHLARTDNLLTPFA